jgi:hypothetical protein
MDSDKAWLRLDPKIWLEGGPRNLSVLLRLFGTGRNLDFYKKNIINFLPLCIAACNTKVSLVNVIMCLLRP